MKTTRETLKILCKSILNRLENQKSISFPPRLRQIVQEEVFQLISPYVKTEEDLREKALERMGAKAELLQDSQFTESDQFKTAKAMVKKTYGDDELNGFYFVKPLKGLAMSMTEYFMRSSHIDDVFETDEDLERKIIEVVKKFNPADAH